MARKAKQASKTGIYHIMVRGINGQSIFYEPSPCSRQYAPANTRMEFAEI